MITDAPKIIEVNPFHQHFSVEQGDSIRMHLYLTDLEDKPVVAVEDNLEMKIGLTRDTDKESFVFMDHVTRPSYIKLVQPDDAGYKIFIDSTAFNNIKFTLKMPKQIKMYYNILCNIRQIGIVRTIFEGQFILNRKVKD